MAARIDFFVRRPEIGAAAGLRQRLGADTAVGAVRASLGLANNRRDVERCVDVIAAFATSIRQETGRLRWRA